MKSRAGLFILLSAAFVWTACRKDSVGGDTQPQGNYLRCTIDGRPFVSGQGTQFTSADRYNNGTSLYISGSATDSEAVFIDIPEVRAGEIGTFPAGVKANLLWYTNKVIRFAPVQSGEVVLTRNDSLVVKGIFNFTNNFSENEVHTFNNGSFEVKMKQ